MMKTSLLELKSFLNAAQQVMVAQLHQFCDINSGTSNLAGLAAMENTLYKAFAPIADTIESIPFAPISTIDMTGNTVLQKCGNALYIRKRPHLKRRILLSGHMDTVYDAVHPFQNLTYINDNCINGPGVADMKGGLIVMLHALIAFEQLPTAQTIGWDVFINADEEIGSPASGLFFTENAKNYLAGLVYEPAMTKEGMLAKNRKGSGKLTLIATGKAAHAGREFQEGRNAICFLAEALTRIHALNGLREGVTINVGLIAGGTALNVVPNKAIAKLDIRITDPDDEIWVKHQIANVVSKPENGYSLTIQGTFGRPVKHISPATQMLFSQIKQLGETIGLQIDWQDSGGCCDGNNLAFNGLGVLDTLGVRGGDIHSAKEFILIDSLYERALLSTLLLDTIAKDADYDVISQCKGK